MEFIFYHQIKPGIPCPDGIAAAWVAHNAYPDANVRGVSYGHPVSVEPQAGDLAIVVDFSFPLEIIDQWLDRGVTIRLIDHHKTAQELLKDSLSDRLGEYVMRGFSPAFDMNECGATLAWKILFAETPMPAFLEFVRSRDLWLDCNLFNAPIPQTLIVHEAIASLKNEIRKQYGPEQGAFILFDAIAWMDREQLLQFVTPLGKPLVQEKREIVTAIAARAKFGTLPGLADTGNLFYVPIVELASDGSEDRYQSDVGNRMCNLNPTAPFCAIVASDGSYGLRSDRNLSDFDVSAVAKLLGGGGHKNAAGFRPTEHSKK